MMGRIVRSGLPGMCAAAAVCVATNVSQAQPSELRGRVALDGSSTVYPITEAAAAAFRNDYPNVDVAVGVSGTGGGFKRFAVGEIDISNASRPIKPEEFTKAKENGVRFLELPVAMDGLSIVVNPNNNWADKLTIDDLRAIYTETGKARKWSDINSSWPDKPIKVYSPGTDSGTFDYFKEVVVKEGQSIRADISTSEDDNVLVTGVGGDQYAIGYFGASYYYENKDKLKAVPIVNPKTQQAVLPEPQYVIDGSYAPLSRPLFIYVNVDSLRRPEVRKFVEYYLANDTRLSTAVGYVAVPEEVGKLAEEFLKKKSAGSTYVTTEMTKREGGLPAVYQAENLHDTK